MTEQKAAVVYADPPWAYRKSPLVNRGRARAVEKEYPTMQPDEIAALPVATWCAPDAVLFLWSVAPKLPIALAVMAAWGFAFRTIGFVWVKTNRDGTPFVGMGFYTRANAECVLIGVRGRGLPRCDASVSQIVLAPRGRHSEKPDEVRRRIERLYAGPRLELFARERMRDWMVWGNEAPTFTGRQP